MNRGRAGRWSTFSKDELVMIRSNKTKFRESNWRRQDRKFESYLGSDRQRIETLGSLTLTDFAAIVAIPMRV